MTQDIPTFKARAYAKLNLSLAVTGRRGGLHTLDMIVCPYEKLWDEATFLPQNSPHPCKTPHIALKTASSYDGFVPALFDKFFAPKLDLIAREFDVSGTVTLKKNIPLGAGLGGSSAAIVAALKSVEKYFAYAKVPHVLSKNFLLSLSSDVPCMYRGGFLRVRGVGEDITPLPPCELPPFEVLIPPISSDSAACYAKYDELLAAGKSGISPAPSTTAETHFTPFDDPSIPTTVPDALSALRNDLTLPATLLYPALAAFRASLLEKYPRVLMSGSGSAFICFPSNPQVARISRNGVYSPKTLLFFRSPKNAPKTAKSVYKDARTNFK